MDIESIYSQLTNVDISREKQIWDERGKGYYGEYLLFCSLYKSISGFCKILMNLNIPVDDSKSTEIDLIMIHETGLYVFEIKHYKGTIFGKDTDPTWTQYFRTTKNSVFKNPVLQNEYHIKALSALFPNIPIHSCIVFTNLDCEIRIQKSNEEIDICKLDIVENVLLKRFSESANKYSLEQIDEIFTTLSSYSQMQKPVNVNGTEASFLSWVQPTISGLEEKKAELEKDRKKAETEANKLKKAKQISKINNVLFCIICVIVSALMCFSVIQKNSKELNSFKQSFLHVDEIGNKYIEDLNSYVNISNRLLLPLVDNGVCFTAKIAMSNSLYGILITETAKYIVMTDSGQVFEYDVFGEHLKYNAFANRIGKGIKESLTLANPVFYGISNYKEVSYIKITGIELFKTDMYRTVVKDNLEIELYSKEK